MSPPILVIPRSSRIKLEGSICYLDNKMKKLIDKPLFVSSPSHPDYPSVLCTKSWVSESWWSWWWDKEWVVELKRRSV